MLINQLHQGLSSHEVAARKAAGKGTAMPPPTGRTYGQIIREDVFTLINNVLFGLCLALLLLGQISEALVSAGTVLFNVIISVIQEVRAKRALDHITLLTRPKATVIRDGQEQSIDPAEIVQDDLLVLHAGDQIVADGPVVGNTRIEVDESLLTGESNLVTKQAGDMLYSGSFCVTGSTYYQAEKLGIESIAGQLTAGARAFRRAYTPLQREINLIIQALLLTALYIETVLVLISLVQQTPIVDTVRMSVVIIGIVPIGLFLATSVAYALGALRIAGQSALVQRLSAIESLSNVDILCLDKTGTLTTNALKLEKLLPFGITEAELRRLLGSYIAHSSSKNATSAAIAAECSPQSRQDPLYIREEIPFSSERKWSALSSDDSELRGVYVLGAPEVLYPFLRPNIDVGTFVEEETARGMRVLLFAYAPDPLPLRTSEDLPDLPHDLLPMGMVSLRDELRPHVQQTITRFTEVGIQIKLISGDNPHTVAALARQVGIINSEKIISQEELASMDDEQLARTAEEQTIFGRVAPQEKARLMQALRHRHHYVAMIGDGVNDVLALKQANLAIAMESGSQATRGVADIVLLKDSFAALPFAFSEGQRIRNGMYNVIKLFLTRVTYLALLLITIPISGGFPFAPKQKSILTFVTASIITVALAAWARPGPSSQGKSRHIFLRFVLPAALTQSLVAFAVYLVAFHLAQQAGKDFADALVIAQSALTAFAVFSGLLLVPFIVPPTRFWTGASELSGDWRPTVLALGLLILYLIMVTIPAIRTFFSLVSLDITSYFLLGCTTLIWGLVQRWIWRFHLLERFLQLDRQ